MARRNLILDRYEPLGEAGAGGFGTVRVAWDPRIQRKVAIKTIQLTELDAYRAALPGAQAINRFPDETAPVSPYAPSTADRWHGATPWNEFLESDSMATQNVDAPTAWRAPGVDDSAIDEDDDPEEPVHALAHLPGLDEARTAAMLSDPRIVTVYDFEVRDRTAYLIMEYVEGLTLTRILRDYGDEVTLDLIAAVFDAVAGALTAAHDAGVLHLDIKPDNILVNANGQAKVTDFGLATLADASGAGTTGGGTIGYMPLEQMRREHLDARTDEWSLAAVTYEMLTGSNPFLAPNLALAPAAIEDAELVLPSLCWDNIDDQIDDVIFYALDPDRDERYDTVAHFAEEADKFLGDAKAGKDQLAGIVADGLGLYEDEGDEEWADWDEGDSRSRSAKRKSGTGFFAALVDMLEGDRAPDERAPVGADAVEFDSDYYVDEAPVEEPRTRRRDRSARNPLAERVPARLRSMLARTFAAVGGGLISLMAVVNMPIVDVFGIGIAYIAIVVALAVAALGALRPHVGAVLSFVLLGAAIAIAGGLIPGIVLVIGAFVWWYLVGRDDMAGSNVALATPILGAVGFAPIVPFLAGVSLKPGRALAATAFSAVIALVLGGLGSGSVMNWDALAHWRFVGTDIVGVFARMVVLPVTWCTLGGWVVASAVLSACVHRGDRRLTIVGAVVASAVIVAASLGFGIFGASFAPQLAVSIALGILVALASGL